MRSENLGNNEIERKRKTYKEKKATVCHVHFCILVVIVKGNIFVTDMDDLFLRVFNRGKWWSITCIGRH